MIHLQLPAFDCKIKQSGGKLYIFDVLRKKYVFLTPEEWVRQHLIHLLLSQHYPASLIDLETPLLYNGLSRRADLVVFDRSGHPYLLAECKGANIELTEDTLQQAAQYNYVLRAPYLLLTNGLDTWYYQVDTQAHEIFRLENLPSL
jgi:hypothetical protein